MNRFVSFSYGLLGSRAERLAPKDLQLRLLRAHLPMRAAAFQSALWIAAACAGTGVALLTFSVLLGLSAPLFLTLIAPILTAALVAGWTLALGPMWLQARAGELEKDIDDNLPAGLNYMLALANAGMPPASIWGSLARAKAFGALAFEAERIRRDLSLLSLDALSAMRAAQERTPSKRFHEFLQGAISSFQSGVELEEYLKNKGEQYQHSATEEQARAIDTMGVMAEAFLVVVVAAPLFLIILLTVMSISQGQSVIRYGFALALVFIPLAQLLIGALIQGSNPKGWT